MCSMPVFTAPTVNRCLTRYIRTHEIGQYHHRKEMMKEMVDGKRDYYVFHMVRANQIYRLLPLLMSHPHTHV